VERIEADVMVTGDTVTLGAAVIIDADKILYAGAADEAPDGQSTTVTRAVAVLPGLWDCHTHLLGMWTIDVNELFTVSTERRSLRCIAALEAALAAGFTSIRELGGLGLRLSPAVAEGSVRGPNIYGAGAMISPTAGHGDVPSLDHAYVSNAGCRAGLTLADGIDGVIVAVRRQLRENADVIKICASGGLMPEGQDHPDQKQFTSSELRAIVEVAGNAGRSVAAHCVTKRPLMMAIEAGVRTIEHAIYLDEECATALREANVVVVPTLMATACLERLYEASYDSANARQFQRIAAVHRDTVAMMYQAGVQIAVGSDISLRETSQDLNWGSHAQELLLMKDAGMLPADVLLSATANGPLTLGDRAPQSGLLQPGYDADITILDFNPLTEFARIADPNSILGVWHKGVRVKGPLMPTTESLGCNSPPASDS